jgi:hypothetical protein
LNKLTLDSIESVDPEPRTEDFEFQLRLAALQADQRGKKGTPAEGSENRLNWELCKSLRASRLVAFYEIPLVKKKKGQLKPDLLVFTKPGKVEIIELKRDGEDDPESPLLALVECICYAIQTIKCWKHLRGEAMNYLKGWPVYENLTNIHLIIAGPNYWTRCNASNQPLTTEQFNRLLAIVDAVSVTLHREQGVALSLSLASVVEKPMLSGWLPAQLSAPDWSLLSGF